MERPPERAAFFVSGILLGKQTLYVRHLPPTDRFAIVFPQRGKSAWRQGSAPYGGGQTAQRSGGGKFESQRPIRLSALPIHDISGISGTPQPRPATTK